MSQKSQENIMSNIVFLDDDDLKWTVFDQAESAHRLAGYDIWEILAWYMVAPSTQRSYVFKGPDFFLIFDHCVDEGMEDYWFIWYAAIKGKPIIDLFKWMPYELPYIAFARTLKESPLKFYKTEYLKRACKKVNYHGIF